MSAKSKLEAWLRGRGLGATLVASDGSSDGSSDRSGAGCPGAEVGAVEVRAGAITELVPGDATGGVVGTGVTSVALQVVAGG